MSTMSELAGVAEIADELGVPRTNISMWDARRRTSGFPEPIARLAAGPVYRMDEIRAWWAARQPKREPV